MNIQNNPSNLSKSLPQFIHNTFDVLSHYINISLLSEKRIMTDLYLMDYLQHFMLSKSL
jgi:hypothetical protein